MQRTRTDRVVTISRCQSAELYYLDPITRELRPLHRVPMDPPA